MPQAQAFITFSLEERNKLRNAVNFCQAFLYLLSHSGKDYLYSTENLLTKLSERLDHEETFIRRHKVVAKEKTGEENQFE